MKAFFVSIVKISTAIQENVLTCDIAMRGLGEWRYKNDGFILLDMY
jgi:hypothetical protein